MFVLYVGLVVMPLGWFYLTLLSILNASFSHMTHFNSVTFYAEYL